MALDRTVKVIVLVVPIKAEGGLSVTPLLLLGSTAAKVESLVRIVSSAL